MKKQIALAVLLLAGNLLFANTEPLSSDDEQTSQEDQSDQEDVIEVQKNISQQNADQQEESSPEREASTPLCSLFDFSFLKESTQNFAQSMQDRVNHTLLSMQIKTRLHGIVQEVVGALAIEGQQEGDEKSEQSENGKDEKDKEIEKLRKQVQEKEKQLQKIKDDQIISDKKYAQWLSENQDEEQQ